MYLLRGIIKLTFLETDCFPQRSHHYSLPPTAYETSILYTLPRLGMDSLFILAVLRDTVVLHLMTDDVQYLFLCISHLYIFFSGLSFQIHCPLICWSVGFLLIDLCEIFLFWVQVLYQIYYLETFSPSQWLVF